MASTSAPKGTAMAAGVARLLILSDEAEADDCKAISAFDSNMFLNFPAHLSVMPSFVGWAALFPLHSLCNSKFLSSFCSDLPCSLLGRDSGF